MLKIEQQAAESLTPRPGESVCSHSAKTYTWTPSLGLKSVLSRQKENIVVGAGWYVCRCLPAVSVISRLITCYRKYPSPLRWVSRCGS